MGFAISLVLAAAPLLCLAPVHAQDPPFNRSPNLVRVDVSVASDLEPISGLTAEHFTVLDNGVKQKIERVLHEQVPLEVLLVLDLSSSVAEGTRPDQVKAAVRMFAAGLTPGDRVALVAASGIPAPAMLQPLTGDFEAFTRSLDELKPGGSTALYDAAMLALTMRMSADTHSLVIMLTDGTDTVSRASEDRVVRAAERCDAIVYVITPPTIWGPTPEARLTQSLADVTGGRVLRAGTGRQLEEAFRSILADIRGRYLITYRPDRLAPGWHTLKVTLDGVKGSVLARKRYYAAATPQTW